MKAPPCEECKWFRLDDSQLNLLFQIRFARCASPSAEENQSILDVSPKLASLVAEMPHCKVKRKYSCRGKWFEPKEKQAISAISFLGGRRKT